MRNALRMALVALGLLLVTAPVAPTAPIFDVHIHYSHDVWDKIPSERAIEKLRAAGITRAMVSSSSDEGTQRLYRTAPDLIIPALRPYRRRGTLDSWMYDESLIPYLEQRLQKYRYAAIGEFHLGDPVQVELQLVQRIIQLAGEYKLLLHVHADANVIERIYRHDPAARILWAHAGFESAGRVKQMLQRYPQLWADLSFRWEILNAANGRFVTGWRELLVQHPDRFMLGVDTYTPLRWLEIPTTLEWYQALFNELPGEVVTQIRYANAQRVIGESFPPP